MTPPLRAQGDGVELDVVVVPRASRSQIAGLHGDRLRVQLAAPPVDGAANDALVDLLAETLQRPRSAISLVSGQASKRKRVRIRGLELAVARTRLGLGAALLAALSTSACSPVTEAFDVKVVLPDNHDLGGANNASLVVEPGFSQTIETRGVDFGFEVEFEPDGVTHELSVYLARDDELLAWGGTPAFTWSGIGDALAVFVGRPGLMSTFPGVLDVVDGGLLAADVPGRGVVIVATGGATSFFDATTLALASGAPLGPAPAPSDGLLVGDPRGGALRVTIDEGLAAHRFDVGDNAWVDIPVAGDGILTGRSGASWVVDGDGRILSLFGGGESREVLTIDLLPNDSGNLVARAVPQFALDAPRVGARATWLLRSDTDEGEDVLLAGADDDQTPLFRLVQSGQSFGPSGPWVGLGCVQLGGGEAASALRVLCAGGLRGGEPTGDGVLVQVPPGGPPSAVEQPGLLPVAMADPYWLRDRVAVYAQGAGALVPVDRTTLQAGAPTPASRERGGVAIPLSWGASLILGGSTAGGVPNPRLQFFTPTP